MRHCLVTASVVVAACCMSAPAWAHPHTAAGVVRTGDASQRMKLQAEAEAVKVKAKHMQTPARQATAAALPANTVASDGDNESSGHGTYGTLAATLILMIAIAVRRQRLGKS